MPVAANPGRTTANLTRRPLAARPRVLSLPVAICITSWPLGSWGPREAPRPSGSSAHQRPTCLHFQGPRRATQAGARGAGRPANVAGRSTRTSSSCASSALLHSCALAGSEDPACFVFVFASCRPIFTGGGRVAGHSYAPALEPAALCFAKRDHKRPATPCSHARNNEKKYPYECLLLRRRGRVDKRYVLGSTENAYVYFVLASTDIHDDRDSHRDAPARRREQRWALPRAPPRVRCGRQPSGR